MGRKHGALLKNTGCTCRRSKCVKLYCVCFANGLECSNRCTCNDCANRPGSDGSCKLSAASNGKQESTNELRSPSCVASSAAVATTSAAGSSFDIGRVSPVQSSTIPTATALMRALPPEIISDCCCCKKSKCLARYCQCYASAVRCTASCTCVGCLNKTHNIANGGITMSRGVSSK